MEIRSIDNTHCMIGNARGKEREGRKRERCVHCWIRDFWDSLTINCCNSCLSPAESLERSSCCCERLEEASMLTGGVVYAMTLPIMSRNRK